MHGARGTQDGGEEDRESIRCCICLAALVHFSAGSIVEQHIRVIRAQLPIVAHIATAVTRERKTY